MIKPKITAKKGKTSTGEKYILVKLTKYSGKNVEIYVKNGKKFKRVKLMSSSIKKYRGNFKLRYKGSSGKMKIKVRSYKINKGKRVYSEYSSEQLVKA